MSGIEELVGGGGAAGGGAGAAGTAATTAGTAGTAGGLGSTLSGLGSSALNAISGIGSSGLNALSGIGTGIQNALGAVGTGIQNTLGLGGPADTGALPGPVAPPPGFVTSAADLGNAFQPSGSLPGPVNVPGIPAQPGFLGQIGNVASQLGKDALGYAKEHPIKTLGGTAEAYQQLRESLRGGSSPQATFNPKQQGPQLQAPQISTQQQGQQQRLPTPAERLAMIRR